MKSFLSRFREDFQVKNRGFTLFCCIDIRKIFGFVKKGVNNRFSELVLSVTYSTPPPDPETDPNPLTAYRSACRPRLPRRSGPPP